MRILVVTNLYPPVTLGGYETCCGLAVDRLRDCHAVTVLTSDVRADEVTREGWIRRSLPLFSGVAGDTLTAPWLTFRAIREVNRCVAAVAPDLVYIWAGARIPKGAIRVLETAGIPLAFSIHDYWCDRPYDHDPFTRYLTPGDSGIRGIWSRLIRLVNRLPGLRLELDSTRPAAICWNSEATRSGTALSPTLKPTLEQVIYPATVHERPFSALHRRPGKRVTILFIGRVSPEKGPEVALRALQRVIRDHGVDADLVVCGPITDATRRDLETLAWELGISNHLRLLGARPVDQLVELLEQAHVLLVPSVWAEPFGLTCLEGALARVPVVASRAGGMTEILSDEEHALFFSIGDDLAAAAAIARVLSCPEETTARVARAYERASVFSIDRFRAQSEAFVDAAYSAATGQLAPNPRAS